MLRTIVAVALITPSLILATDIAESQVIEDPKTEQPTDVQTVNRDKPKEEPKEEKKPELTPGTSSETPPTDNGEDTPLAIELKTDGPLFHSSTVVFDIGADGNRHHIQWPNAQRFALLVWDRNNNGQVDDGGELIGSSTKIRGKKARDGFEVLNYLDRNKDGLFDSNDPGFNSFLVWTDVNQNGVSEKGELVELNKVGVSNITVAAKTPVPAQAGVLLQSQYAKTPTGLGTGRIFDLLFKRLPAVSMGGAK